MITFQELSERKDFRVESLVTRHERYLAHLPKPNSTLKPETLAEHADLVLDFSVKLSAINGVESVVDKIINQIIDCSTISNKAKFADYLKAMFFDSIAFHDFGKTNENFQVARMKNTEHFSTVKTIIKPEHGHSELGAFIFIVYYLEKIGNDNFDSEDDQVLLSTFALILSNAIILHHQSSIYKTPQDKVKGSIFLKNLLFLKPYLDNYKFSQPEITEGYLENLDTIFDSFFDNKKLAFYSFALLRLNFSLLTASDYLATSSYMNDMKIERFDLGTISNQLRKHIIEKARNSKTYNQKAFEKAKLLKGGQNEEIPIERSNENLNKLRERMAAEAIVQVRTHAHERLFYLEAPTGGGKTNISMLVASELLDMNPEINKIFYVFPFTTLITQTNSAILETFELTSNEVALMHSKAGFQTKEMKNEENEDGLYSNDKTNYLNNLFAFYPICLLTHIRFFDMLKSNEKETIYLMHRLANSIVIIDELQSYNPLHWDKMLYFIKNYADLFNIRFVLMSATLPKIDKLKIPLQNKTNFIELLPNSSRFFTNPNFANRISFNFELLKKKDIDLNTLADKVIEKSKDWKETKGVKTIIEFIFKKSASDFKGIIENKSKFFDEIFVLSGTILESRRREIINYLKNEHYNDKRVLLITTQVVEAGVDIDMDIGFKNISLIDSDEQLAGRVNRNVKKELCEVYLFKINESSILYKKDLRFQVTRENINITEHEAILKSKNFNLLYDKVLSKIDELNGKEVFQNFNTDYLPEFQQLNYKEIHKKFQLIEQDNVSIFVPLDIPIKVKSERFPNTPQYEKVFSDSELSFLKKANIYFQGEETVSGERVWQLYRDLILNRKEDFIEQVVSLKTLQGILSKFTFSIFYNDKVRLKFTEFRDIENDFEKYWYLRFHNKVYDYKGGILDNAFDNIDNQIL